MRTFSVSQVDRGLSARPYPITKSSSSFQTHSDEREVQQINAQGGETHDIQVRQGSL